MKTLLLFFCCAFSIAVSAQSYTEGADLPATGPGPGFYADPGVTVISGTLNTPGDSADYFQVYVTFGNWIDSVKYQLSDSTSMGVISFGATNLQSFPPRNGSFANGPTGPFPVAQGIYSCYITASAATNTSWTIAFFGNGTNGIADNFASQQFSIYPNPAGDVFFVNGNLLASAQGILVVENIFGQKIFTETISSGENQTAISTAAFPPGIYFCRMIVNGEVRATEKIAVQH